MDEGWHVAGMILTVQVAEKRKLAAHTTAQPPASRTAVLYSRATQAPMAIAIPSGRVRFATFEVDLRSGELHKQGIKIKLHDQPFQVLTMLLEHPGELVTREQLHQKLWPSDTFVDFDVGLNSAIKRLRDALGDSAEEPRYIETLPRRGYRFQRFTSTPPRSWSPARLVAAWIRSSRASGGRYNHAVWEPRRWARHRLWGRCRAPFEGSTRNGESVPDQASFGQSRGQ